MSFLLDAGSPRSTGDRWRYRCSSVPSVAMNGGRFGRVTSRPLMSPYGADSKADKQGQPSRHPVVVAAKLAITSIAKDRGRAHREVDAGGKNDQV